jgi:hypothetical protein
VKSNSACETEQTAVTVTVPVWLFRDLRSGELHRAPPETGEPGRIPPSLDGSWREPRADAPDRDHRDRTGQGAVAQIAVTETARVLLLPVFQKFADH